MASASGHPTLAKNPEIGRLCTKGVSPDMYWFLVDKNIVYYRPEATRIVITHVFDGRWDQQKALRKTKPATKRAKKRSPKP